MAKTPDPTDKLLEELVAGKTRDEILGKDGILKQLTKRLVEQALEGEMTHHLGYEPHAPEGKNTGNSRNGKTTKTVIGDAGEMEIVVPRDRNGEFEPALIPKRHRRLPEFDDKVIALYARGMTTREIQGHLHELYGVEVSPQLISAVTDSVMEDVATWQSRPLDPIYPIVYLDALHVKMRHEGRVQSQAVYLALGITLEGKKELLGLWIGENEGAKFWLSVVTELKNRGVQDMLIVCVDGLKGFPDAIGTVYPKAQVQLCIIHMVRHSLKFVGWKDRKAVAADLKAVYSAPTVEAAEMALDAFEDKWAGRFPSIAKSWRSNWVNLIPFFSYPPEIRKVIYTTNAIESMQSSLRKMTRQRGSFPNPESVRKVMYLALARIAKNWQRPIRDWTAALNHFSVVFEGRI